MVTSFALGHILSVSIFIVVDIFAFAIAPFDGHLEEYDLNFLFGVLFRENVFVFNNGNVTPWQASLTGCSSSSWPSDSTL